MQAPKRRRQTGSTEIEQGKLFTEKKKKNAYSVDTKITMQLVSNTTELLRSNTAWRRVTTQAYCFSLLHPCAWGCFPITANF